MAKNSEKKPENSVCEKIFRAMTNPVRTVRRISAKPSPSHPAEAVHVKFSETPVVQAAKPVTNTKPKKAVITRVETTMKTDERFADYIKKGKLKIRAMTNLGDMMNYDASETSSETETHHHHHHHHHVPVPRVGSSGRSDHFSEYIKKAKIKLRSSSTISTANPTYDSFNFVKD